MTEEAVVEEDTTKPTAEKETQPEPEPETESEDEQELEGFLTDLQSGGDIAPTMTAEGEMETSEDEEINKLLDSLG